jgi:hypothetical protein
VSTYGLEFVLPAGMPRASPSVWQTDAQGWPFAYQLYALVESVSPSTGSTAGGTLITIQGQGFPTLALRQDMVTVSVSGQPCSVRTSNFTTITCMTQPLPAGYAAPAAIGGAYPGEHSKISSKACALWFQCIQCASNAQATRCSYMYACSG